MQVLSIVIHYRNLEFLLFPHWSYFSCIWIVISYGKIRWQ